MLKRPVRASACVLFLAVATATLAGCGGGGSKQKTLPTTSTTAAASAATISQIRQNWAQFFDGSTSSSDRMRLLQNGDKFKSVLDALDSSAIVKQVKARVGRVKLTNSTTASVTYTVLLAGQPVLRNAKGQAVLVDGTWKVGVGSFCGLAKLEGVVPAACAGK